MGLMCVMESDIDCTFYLQRDVVTVVCSDLIDVTMEFFVADKSHSSVFSDFFLQVYGYLSVAVSHLVGFISVCISNSG